MALYCFVTSYRRLLVIVFVSHFNEWMLMKKINRFIFKYFVGTASCFVMRFATGLVSAEGIFHLNKGSISMRRSGLRRQMAIQLRRDSFVYESVQTSGASSLNVSSRRAAIRYDRVSLHVSLSLSLLSLISLHSDWLIKRPQLGLDDLDRCTGHWPRTVWFFFYSSANAIWGAVVAMADVVFVLFTCASLVDSLCNLSRRPKKHALGDACHRWLRLISNARHRQPVKRNSFHRNISYSLPPPPYKKRWKQTLETGENDSVYVLKEYTQQDEGNSIYLINTPQLNCKVWHL